MGEYVVVAGHYPVYSICEHGPTSFLVDSLKPLLEKFKVSAYMNGHDHCAQYIDIGDGVQYHTIGSAHLNNPDTSHKDTIPANALKFHSRKSGFQWARCLSLQWRWHFALYCPCYPTTIKTRLRRVNLNNIITFIQVNVFFFYH